MRVRSHLLSCYRTATTSILRPNRTLAYRSIPYHLATYLPTFYLLPPPIIQMLVRSINEGRTMRDELEGFAIKRPPTNEGWSGGGGGGGGRGGGGTRRQGGGGRR